MEGRERVSEGWRGIYNTYTCTCTYMYVHSLSPPTSRQLCPRFLRVRPITVPDKSLLSCLLRTLRWLLDSTAMEQLCGGSFLSWVAEATAGPDGVCIETLQLLVKPQTSEKEAGIDR